MTWKQGIGITKSDLLVHMQMWITSIILSRLILHVLFTSNFQVQYHVKYIKFQSSYFKIFYSKLTGFNRKGISHWWEYQFYQLLHFLSLNWNPFRTLFSENLNLKDVEEINNSMHLDATSVHCSGSIKLFVNANL